MSYVAGSAVASNAAAATSLTNASWALSGAANRKVVVGVFQEDDGNNGWVCSGVTFNAVAMTRLNPTGADLAVGSTRRRLSMWYMDEASLPGAGNYAVVATMASGSSTIDNLGMIVAEFSSQASGAGVDPQTSTTAAGTSLSVTHTPTVNASTIVLMAFSSAGSGTAVTDATGWTASEIIDATFGGNANYYLSVGDLATAAAVTAGITFTASGTLGLCVIALSPAASGAGAIFAHQYRQRG